MRDAGMYVSKFRIFDFLFLLAVDRFESRLTRKQEVSTCDPVWAPGVSFVLGRRDFLPSVVDTDREPFTGDDSQSLQFGDESY